MYERATIQACISVAILYPSNISIFCFNVLFSESQARELNQHRTRTIEVESEVERLKRQLISERFERSVSIVC